MNSNHSPKNRRRRALPILALFVVLLLAACGGAVPEVTVPSGDLELPTRAVATATAAPAPVVVSDPASDDETAVTGEPVTAGDPADPALDIVYPNPNIAYKTYENAMYGFAFDYPAVYDEPSDTTACGINEGASPPFPMLFTVNLGYRIWMSVVDSQGQSLTDYINEVIAQNQAAAERDGALFELAPSMFPAESNGQVVDDGNGEGHVTIEYRFSTNRYGRKTVFSNNGNFIVIDFTAGGFCDFPEAGVTELETSMGVVLSFRRLG